MAKTYRATGINLKGMPLGEQDRLLTILTKERGLIRAVASGVRKYGSKLGGRAELFVVNDLLISQGRNLDRIAQAETRESFLGLGQNLAKLTCAQYLAELTLRQALSNQPQEELFYILTDRLQQIQSQSSLGQILPVLSRVFTASWRSRGLRPNYSAVAFLSKYLQRRGKGADASNLV